MCRYLCISSWCTFYITFRYDSYDYIAIYSLVGGILILQKQNLFNGISLQLEMFLFKSFSSSECVACHVQEQADELASREVAQSMGLATPTLPWSDSCSKQCQRGRFIDSTNRNVMAAWGLLNKNYKNTKQKGKLGLILSIHMYTSLSTRYPTTWGKSQVVEDLLQELEIGSWSWCQHIGSNSLHVATPMQMSIYFVNWQAYVFMINLVLLLTLRTYIPQKWEPLYSRSQPTLCSMNIWNFILFIRQLPTLAVKDSHSPTSSKFALLDFQECRCDGGK